MQRNEVKEEASDFIYDPRDCHSRFPVFSDFQLYSRMETRALKLANSSNKTALKNALAMLGDSVTSVVDKDGNTFLHLVTLHNTADNLNFVLKKLGKKLLRFVKYLIEARYSKHARVENFLGYR